MQRNRDLIFQLGLPAMLVVLTFAGCSGGGGGGLSSGGNGTLQASMVDAPDPSVSAVTITIDRVQAHIADISNTNDNNDGNWQTLTTAAQTINLLDFAKVEKLLGSATLPAGHYTQIRLFVSSASVTDKDGTFPLNIPSALQTGLKINVNYDINPNQITTILLDFNVNRSLDKLGNGQYQLHPVIPATVKVLSGTVTGTVVSNGAPVRGATITATPTSGATTGNSTMTLADGTFKVWALLPGTYTITASFTDAGGTKTATKTGVVVTANQNTEIGTLMLQ